MRRLSMIVLFVFALSFAALSVPNVSANASSLSPGCTAYNTSGFVHGPLVMNANERITVTITITTIPGSATLNYFYDQLSYNSGPTTSVISASTLGVYNYTIPATGLYTIDYSYTYTGPGTIRFVYQCTATPDLGPTAPQGFVLHTITCNTPLFTTAGGVALPTGEAFKAGQTWFVSPTPVKDSKGQSWTEVFAGGYTDGFIPSTCVG